MAQERKAAAQQSASEGKKAAAKDNILVDENHVPTAEELRRRQMRAGRFGKGALDHSAPVRPNAPVYAVRLSAPLTLALQSTGMLEPKALACVDHEDIHGCL